MFCTSLRKRKEWAPAVAKLANSTGLSWKETKLETHDVAFPTRSRPGRDGCFRLLLLAAADVGTPQANERIERLPLLDGRGKTAVIFLLAGQDDMEAFMALQMQYALAREAVESRGPMNCEHAPDGGPPLLARILSRDDCIPVMPVSSADELSGCLDSLRRQCTAAADAQRPHQDAATSAQRHVLAHCTRGGPLSEGQTDVLSDICTGFGHLAQQAFDRDGQDKLCDFLGDADGKRVAAFLTAGPVARLG